MKFYEFIFLLLGVITLSLGLVWFFDLFFEDEVERVMAWFSRLWWNK